MNEHLQKQIQNFLREKRNSEGGGWSPVTVDDYVQLHQIIGSLLELKWERDGGGDLPIEHHLIDRTKGFLPGLLPILHPYWRDDDTVADHIDRLELLTAKMNSLAGSADQELKATSL